LTVKNNSFFIRMSNRMFSLPLVGVGVAALSVVAYGKRFFNGAVNPHTNVDLKNKIVIVTGANTGIGFETVSTLSSMGAHVIAACRDQKKGQEVIKKIKSKINKASVEFIKLDLEDKKSIKQFAEEFKKNHEKLDILINNAGVMACPLSKTKDGFEMQIGVNHLGHFYLTSLLMESLKAAPKSRVVNVSSRAHFRGGPIDFEDINWNTRPYVPLDAYGQSKLANVLFSHELNKRYSEHNITSYSLHPGVIRTELGRHIVTGWKKVVFFFAYPVYWYFTKDVWHGAQSTIYCAVAPGLEKEGGKYFSDCAVTKPKPDGENDGIAKKLWEKSEQLLGIKFGEKN